MLQLRLRRGSGPRWGSSRRSSRPLSRLRRGNPLSSLHTPHPSARAAPRLWTPETILRGPWMPPSSLITGVMARSHIRCAALSVAALHCLFSVGQVHKSYINFPMVFGHSSAAGGIANVALVSVCYLPETPRRTAAKFCMQTRAVYGQDLGWVLCR